MRNTELLEKIKNGKVAVLGFGVSNSPLVKFLLELGVKDITVYDKKHAEENNVEINCGAKSCVTCRNCYDRPDFYTDIREALK